LTIPQRGEFGLRAPKGLQEHSSGALVELGLKAKTEGLTMGFQRYERRSCRRSDHLGRAGKPRAWRKRLHQRKENSRRIGGDDPPGLEQGGRLP